MSRRSVSDEVSSASLLWRLSLPCPACAGELMDSVRLFVTGSGKLRVEARCFLCEQQGSDELGLDELQTLCASGPLRDVLLGDRAVAAVFDPANPLPPISYTDCGCVPAMLVAAKGVGDGNR